MIYYGILLTLPTLLVTSQGSEAEMDNFTKFDDISYNPHTRELIKQRKSIYLRRKVSEVLDILLKNRHRIVGREELLTSIWREGSIRENSLLQCVRELRQILGDTVQQPKYIKTYHTNGYQWIDTHIAIIETDNNTALEQVTTNIPISSTADTSIKNRLIKFSEKIIPSQLIIAGFILFFGVTVFFYFFNSSPIKQANSNQDNITLAVLPFNNQTADTSLQWVEMGLSDMVMSALSQSSQISIVPMYVIQETLSEQSATASESELLLALEADYLIKSKIILTKLQNYEFIYQIFNHNGVIASQTLPTSDIIAAIPTIVRQFSNQLLPENNDLLTLLSLSTNHEASRDYANGVQALKTKGAPLAKRHFEAAIINDPKFMWAKAQLALVFSKLGEWKIAKIQFKEMLQQQEINNDLTLSSFLKLGLANIFFEQSQFDRAEILFQEVITLNEKTNNRYRKAKALWGLSNIAEYRSQWEKQNDYAQQAIALTNNVAELRIKADNLYYLGSPSNSRLEIDNTIDMQKNRDRLERALNYYTQLQDIDSQAKTLLSMGENYTFNFKQRIDFLKRATKLYQQLDNKIQLVNTLSYTGFLYIQYHQGGKALFPLQTSFQIVKSIGAVQAELYNHYLLAFAALDQGINHKNDKEKMQYLNIAQQQFMNLRNDPRLLRDSQLYAYSSLLLGWAVSEQGKHTQAINYMQQSLDISRDLKQEKSTAYSIMSLAREYVTLQNWKQALQYVNSSNLNKRTRQYLARSYYELKQYNKAVKLAEFNKSLNVSKWTPQDDAQLDRYRLSDANKLYLKLPPEPGAHTTYCEALPENT